MKKLWVALMIVMMGMTSGITSVEAKRLGGGGSFGKSSPSPARPAPMQNAGQQATPRPAAPAAPAPASPWRGIVGGALLGLGIGALLSHFGMGAELGNMMSSFLMIALIGLAIFFIVRLLARRSAAAGPQPSYATGYTDQPAQRVATPDIGSNLDHSSTASGSASWETSQAPTLPQGFDSAGFLRSAKTNFLRMQAAWDKGDAQDIREFTTPEMFAELKMQLTERGSSKNHTDVVALEADLLGLETTAEEYIASVRFHGTVREEENAAPEAFNETWVLSKPVSGQGGWLLAGLQQN